jgi:hypothetical protein
MSERSMTMRLPLVTLLLVGALVACKKDDAKVRALDETEKVPVKAPPTPSPLPPKDESDAAKLCARIEALEMRYADATNVDEAERAKCVAELQKMKQEDPKSLDCITACMKDGSDGEAAMTCLVGCVVKSKSFAGAAAQQ